MLMEMLTQTHRPFMIVLTKADKVREKETQKRMDEIAGQVKSMASLCNPFIHATCSQ